MKRHPAPKVAGWIASLSPASAFISVVTLAELRSGFDRLPDAARRREHDEWLSGDVVDGFRGRILDVDQHVADVCGRMLARADLDRRAAVTMDIWVAAIAIRYDLTVVTRDKRDLEHLDLRIFNPWSDE